MKRYDSYKPSGISWIGEVPSHWKTRKMKFSFIERSEKNHPNEIKLSATQSHGVIPQFMYEDKGNHVVDVNKNFDGLKLVKVGDFVIHLRSFQGGLAYAYYQGIISAAYTILQPKEPKSAPYYKYLFLSFPYIQLLKTCVTGIREGQNIDYNVLGNKFITIPPDDEQEAIVEFLDSKTSKIDSYVAERERELAILEELRQAEIAQAVTQGLNPDAPMRDSGIPWLGKIPAHWNIKRAKNIFYRVQRPVRAEDEVITCFRDGQVTLRKNRRTEGFTEALQESGYQGIRKGDLVIHQMDAFAGSIGVSDSDGKGTPVYICCLPKFPLNIFYFSHIMREMARSGHIKSLYRGIRERSSDFRYETFAVQYLPIPPLDEQNAIVDYINAKIAKIDGLIADLSAQIEKLKEYKQRLIADAVTGQIDVRK